MNSLDAQPAVLFGQVATGAVGCSCAFWAEERAASLVANAARLQATGFHPDATCSLGNKQRLEAAAKRSLRSLPRDKPDYHVDDVTSQKDRLRVQVGWAGTSTSISATLSA
jgi:hypothetical protein